MGRGWRSKPNKPAHHLPITVMTFEPVQPHLQPWVMVYGGGLAGGAFPGAVVRLGGRGSGGAASSSAQSAPQWPVTTNHK